MTHKRSLNIVITMSILGTLFITAVLVFMFLPTFRDVRSLSFDVTDAQAELEAQYANRKNLIANTDRIQKVRKITEELIGQFVEPGQELTFIKTVEAIGELNEVDTSIRLNPKKSSSKTKDAGLPNDRFEITLNGSSHNVYRYVTELESIRNMVTIDSFTLRANTIKEGEPKTISLSLRGKIIFTPENL